MSIARIRLVDEITTVCLNAQIELEEEIAKQLRISPLRTFTDVLGRDHSCPDEVFLTCINAHRVLGLTELTVPN